MDTDDVRRTPTGPGQDGSGSDGGAPRFVVQIHDARRMHFDFRLEVDGVLKSWAVPRGPSENPRDKRLAVPTQDHPLAYQEFEGVIPPDEQGGGTVIVWDQGTYRPLSHDERGTRVSFEEALERGHATFWLDGAKLHGEFALTRFRVGDEGPGHVAWLLVKADDDQAVHDRPGTPDPYHARSARTGRTLHQVEAAERQHTG
ncbi:DNA polymerase ligase N-terminal domain-containing protein [Streptomyces fulvorobeus]|uniref:3'-phosphoesterase n=1 Tax=Streptomyces fulvorobeus TaxID=284028 RepID=A0A7J0BZR7_9ACTN|nr:DNA polymerase ligase N-terminal domain-containing protein [Streptomyces fulvorobeus]NYE39487.1 DNA ligase D-like protein (predicted 3'-phosphoesterase) [Streptomyces fulvorobeus]GFM95721.1 3'-phosphoesterase [Streptomyces fulvorobeus]